MKNILILSLLLVSFFVKGICQTAEGPVLKPELAGKYEGELKKGLANGKGTAIGRDTYTGSFRRGLPDGTGTYQDHEGNIYKGEFRYGLKEGKGELTFKESGKISVMTGYWEADKYIGTQRRDPYEISNQTGGVSPRIFSAGPGNKVEICILNPVTSSPIGATIMVSGQANFRTLSGRYYYEDAAFPIEFDIQYTCSNKLGTASIANTIRIKINKPGNWVVTLKN